MAERRGFAATVVPGVAAAALASVAAAKPWFSLGSDRPALQGIPPSETVIDMPLALALSLVVLAGWGAVLVARGVLRRVLVLVALLAALGLVACVATAPFRLPDELRDGLALSSPVSARPTGWFFTAAIASLIVLLALVQAWRLAPGWPTMSTRYDAPATRAVGADETDLWKALDAGQDPTDPDRQAGPSHP